MLFWSQVQVHWHDVQVDILYSYYVGIIITIIGVSTTQTRDPMIFTLSKTGGFDFTENNNVVFG